MDTANTPLSDRAATFATHRARLFGIAYRMLGSRAEAEDVVQEAYVRWHQSGEAKERADIRTPEAWLVTVTTRLAIDRLRELKAERESYPGAWLPEPLVAPLGALGEDAQPEPVETHTPESVLEFSSDVSTAFLLVLERLGPEERAAFLLREVFDMDYREVAQMLGKSETTCRQLVHRAKERVRQNRPRFEVSRAAHVKLLERFVEAARGGNIAQLQALFAEDATFVGDGGGKVPALSRVISGALRLARFYHVIARRYPGVFTYRVAEINGMPGLLRFMNGKLESASTFVTDGQKILDIYTVRNPDKLAAIAVPG